METGNLPLSQSRPARRDRRALVGPSIMLASACSFTALDALVKIMGPQYRVWDLAFFRWGGGLVLMLLCFGWSRNALRTHAPKLMLLRGLTGCAAFLSLTVALRTIPMSTAMTLFFCFPAFAALFAGLLLGERLRRVEMLCLAAIPVGAAVLLDLEVQGAWIGYGMGLLASVLAGVTICLVRKLRERDGPVAIYLYFCLTGAIVSFGAAQGRIILPESTTDWLMAGGIAASSAVAQMLMNLGLKTCRSWEGGLYLTVELVFAALVGIVVLGEPATWRFFLGSGLILGTAVLINLAKARPASPEPGSSCTGSNTTLPPPAVHVPTRAAS